MNQNTLPEAFLQRMEKSLGSSYEDFLKSYKNPPLKALRVNTLKAERDTARCLLEKASPRPVPWNPDAFIVDADFSPLRDESYHLGLYYPQEPSAMIPALALDAKPGEKVADLCAAPGGKSTQLACAMQGEGFLLSNEYVPKRAKILASNMERMGVENAVITSCDTKALADALPAFFDKILIDAPCSGEGMFRKDETAVREWREDLPEACAARDREILQNADRMLRPGGEMVFSTCTFSPEENDGMRDFLVSMGYELLSVPLDGIENLEDTKDLKVYPHLNPGEGHYIARLRKPGEEEKAGRKKKKKRAKAGAIRPASAKEKKIFESFRKENFPEKNFSKLLVRGESLYSAPESFDPDLFEKVRVLTPGLKLGTFKKDRFEPDHALAMSLRAGQMREAALSGEEYQAYLRGEEIARPGEKNGWVLLTRLGTPAGFGKIAGGRMKNKLPKGLRVQGVFS